jgi:hypothetical protein
MQDLLTLNYWFSLRVIPFTPAAERGLLVLFGIFTIVGIGTTLFLLKRKFAKPTKRALGKFASLLSWSGLFGLLLWLFTYQGVPVLSMRIFYIPWVLWVIWGFYSIYKYLWVEVPGKQKIYDERIEREKWLPKKK